ncbi:MAG TPA: hypothetical protein PK191_06000 [Niabella sp.]|nr:hypothetical protein [Niabella sp.]HOZ96287.1 hypothetical protein [Niabella sp.]HQW14639.1 hypothetical protein [Niabella sp.]HQX19778.1 hypothetical protein [Niabella sp.]HQX41122.1 hypothetical protein [Niabella sp.]
MKKLAPLAILSLVFALTNCCPSNRQSKQPPAKEALPDRNTKDSKIDSLANKKVEVAIPIND